MVVIDRTADCTVRAVNSALDLKDWFLAEREMKKAGYIPGKGASMIAVGLCLWNITGKKPLFMFDKHHTIASFVEKYPNVQAILFSYSENNLHAMGVRDNQVFNRQNLDYFTPVIFAYIVP